MLEDIVFILGLYTLCAIIGFGMGFLFEIHWFGKIIDASIIVGFYAWIFQQPVSQNQPSLGELAIVTALVMSCVVFGAIGFYKGIKLTEEMKLTYKVVFPVQLK